MQTEKHFGKTRTTSLRESKWRNSAGRNEQKNNKQFSDSKKEINGGIPV